MRNDVQDVRKSRETVHRKRSFSKTFLKTELCVLVWTENILKTELFANDDVTIIRCSVCPSLPQTQIQNGGRNGEKWRTTKRLATYVGSTKTLLCACLRVHSSVSAACDCCVFKFLRRSVDEKHLMRLQSETSVTTDKTPPRFGAPFMPGDL